MAFVLALIAATHIYVGCYIYVSFFGCQGDDRLREKNSTTTTTKFLFYFIAIFMCVCVFLLSFGWYFFFVTFLNIYIFNLKEKYFFLYQLDWNLSWSILCMLLIYHHLIVDLVTHCIALVLIVYETTTNFSP